MKRELAITLIIIFLLATAIIKLTPSPRQVLATYNNTVIILDGIQISTQNAEPVTINGIIYLPIRTVPEALQMQVDWNEITNTIYINSKTSETNKQYN